MVLTGSQQHKKRRLKTREKLTPNASELMLVKSIVYNTREVSL